MINAILFNETIFRTLKQYENNYLFQALGQESEYSASSLCTTEYLSCKGNPWKQQKNITLELLCNASLTILGSVYRVFACVLIVSHQIS